MSGAPRLLPLLGVAIGGVLAINALSGAKALPQLLSAARAAAEIAAKPGHSAGKGSAPKDVAASGPQSVAPEPATPAAPVAPVCGASAADLAKTAGLSPAELAVLNNLTARRGQIDQREKDLDVQTQLLAAAEIKLDAKIKTMAGLKAQIESLLGQADQKSQAEVDRLVTVYSKMPPKSAGPVMATLDDKVRVPIAAAMKPAILAAILKEMSAEDAKHLTELLAHRFAPVQQLAAAAAAPPSASKPEAAKAADAEEADPTAPEKPAKSAKPKRAAKKTVAKAKPKSNAADAATPAVASLGAAKTPTAPAPSDKTGG
jgi:flagellar motility protein MotE (MotC chaperone)